MAWTAAWTKGSSGGPDLGRVLSRRGVAYLAIGTSGSNDVDSGDLSEVIELTGDENEIAVNASTAGDAAGAFTMDVRQIISADTLAGSVTVASLSAGTPGVYNLPPGRYLLECTADADAAGEVIAVGRGRTG